MPLDFPSSPSVNDTYSASGTTWRWDGTVWNIVPTVESFLSVSGTQALSNKSLGSDLNANNNTVTNLKAPSQGTDAATKSYADTAALNAAAGVINSAPSTLDTLKELADALGNDANFATSVTTALGGKVSKSGDSMSGNLTVSGTVDASTYLQNGAALEMGLNPYFLIGV